MSISNEELVEKAVITTDAIAAAGKLNPAQSDKFIDYVIEETVLKNNARIVRFRNEDLEIEKIGVGKRVALPKTEASDPQLRRGVTTSKVVLTPREIIVPWEIGDTFKETNIEGMSVEDHVIRMMATQLANDMEELYILGDLLGAAALQSDLVENGSSTQYVKDTYLALFDGWMRLADGANTHQVDAAGANVGNSVFSSMIRAMPTKFRRNRNNLRFYISPDLAQLYREKLSTRATNLGDSAVGGGGVAPFGIPLVEVPLLPQLVPVTEHLIFTGSGSTVSLRYSAVSSLVVVPSTLNKTPTTPYIDPTDYTVNEATGVVTHAGGGSAIGTTETVKITYLANPQLILTHMSNFIVGIGRDIRIEKDRDIYKGVNQYAITAKVSVNFEEEDAIVKASNIGTGV
jgi:hypothetical protein